MSCSLAKFSTQTYETLMTRCCHGGIKGAVSRDFLFLVLFTNQFPPAPEYCGKTVSNFFENSWRYSQLKVCHRCQQHRWQMEKIFNQKNFNNFVWSPLGSRGNIYINFGLQVHFQSSIRKILIILFGHLWEVEETYI